LGVFHEEEADWPFDHPRSVLILLPRNNQDDVAAGKDLGAIGKYHLKASIEDLAGVTFVAPASLAEPRSELDEPDLATAPDRRLTANAFGRFDPGKVIGIDTPHRNASPSKPSPPLPRRQVQVEGRITGNAAVVRCSLLWPLVSLAL
jgi:hypothetical protein